MDLPSPIRNYVEADRRHDVERFVAAFAPDAVVVDEGRSHAGHPAIDAWWRAAKAEFDHVAVPFGIDVKDDVTEVRAEVTGRFPGSPATLTYAFRLGRDLISRLEITA